MILLVSQYRYPEGDAGAVRLHYFAKTLQNLGYEVLVIGLGDSTDGIAQYQGIPYVSLRVKNRYSTYLLYTGRLRKLFNQLGEKSPIDAIVCGYMAWANGLIFLKSYCQKRGIKLIKDVVEWYSPQQFAWGRCSFSFHMKDIENRWVVSPSVRVIAISRYLENYFGSKKCRTVRIPIYFEVDKMPMRGETADDRLHLVYAGSPGRKDYLHMMLKGMALLDESRLQRLRFTLIGVNQQQVEALVSTEIYNRLKASLDIRGRVQRNKVLSALCQADFSLLLRDPEARYAQAGFPTKVIESLSVGLPVICNYSSDLNEFLVDGENALIVDSLSVERFAETLQRAIELSTAEKNKMSRLARQCAESRFNISSFDEAWKRILE